MSKKGVESFARKPMLMLKSHKISISHKNDVIKAREISLFRVWSF